MTITAPVPTVPAADAAIGKAARRPMNYPALITMMLMSFFLVTAEFVPSGMLTSIADGLGVTPGQAGQMVAVTAFAGLIAAPTVGLIFPKLNRRSLLVWLSLAAALSNVLVAISPNLLLVILARFILGAAISGFWSMSISVAAKIAGPDRLGKAVMFNSAGVSLATVAGVPLGVMLSEALDWRSVFWVAAGLSAMLAIVLHWLLPSVPAENAARLSTLGAALRRPGIALGVVANVLVVSGHFLAYTYVRLALERVSEGGTHIGADTIVVLLALFGVGGLVGNVVIGFVVDRGYRALIIVTPVLIAGLILLIIASSGSLWATGGAVVVWGFFYAAWLIIANTWVGNRLPDLLEAGGSLIVVGFQAGITIAAAFGGLLVDAWGIVAVFVIGGAALLIGAALFGISDRISEGRRTRG